MKKTTATLGLVLLTMISSVMANEKDALFLSIDDKILDTLETYCIDCHESDNAKGNIQLDNLSEVPLKSSLETLNKVKEQLFSYNMPPKKKKQPSENERIAVLEWVAEELNARQASTLDSKLALYRYGNLVPHEKLFSGEIKETPYTDPRYWRINEFIYNERVRAVLGKSGLSLGHIEHMDNDRAQGRELDDKIILGLPIVFNLPKESGVTYFDNELISGSNFMALKKNAEWLVGVQLRSTLLKNELFEYPNAFLTTRPRYRNQRFPQYLTKIDTPEVFTKVIESKKASAADFTAAINFQFQRAYQRKATPAEIKRYLTFANSMMKVGNSAQALEKTLVAILMEPEFFYRSEIGKNGKLTPREGSYAISYALTDWIPDPTLASAAKTGKLETQADYAREVRRILNDDKIAKPRILRFFRDYFGYVNTRHIFKDNVRFEGKYNTAKGVSYKFTWGAIGQIIDEADSFVLQVLKEDKEVLKNLLTSNEFFTKYGFDAKKERAQLERHREIYKFILSKREGVKKGFSKSQSKQIAKELKEKFKSNHFGKRNYSVNNELGRYQKMFGPKADKTPPLPMPGPERFYEGHFDPKYPNKVKNRMGILTHPAWLIAHSHNDHTDPIKRGKWIQEKLLAGYTPEVPIEVDAALINDHSKTIRERLVKTEAGECWGCHKKMNPLGYPFESYDDFGRFRLAENLEHEDNVVDTVTVLRSVRFSKNAPFQKKIYKTKPVDASGFLAGTGDNTLDGKVKDSHDLISRLAKSERVRQVFVRNVFRYFMGRNEKLSDSKTLIEADNAYVENGGSFKALLTSILSSESFINRKNSAQELSQL